MSDRLFAATSIEINDDNDTDFKWHLTVDECNSIIELAKDQMKTAKINAISTGGQSVAEEVRKTEVAVLEYDERTEWIYERLGSAIKDVALDFWPFKIDDAQPIQILKYHDGGHYDTHIDLGPLDAAYRKISFTLQLSDPDSYEGGELEIYANSQFNKATREQGALTMFPSYILHKVNPVTSGTRYALVAWFCGEQPFY